MRLALLVSLIFISLAGVSSLSEGSSKIKVLPFKVWKQKKVDEAKAIVSELKRQNKKTIKADEEQDEDRQGAAEKLSQAELNLGVARELSANDYFLLYVAPQFKNNNEAFTQAAKALSPRDMADILAAYQKKIQSSDAYANSEVSPAPAEDVSSSEKTAKAP